MIVRKLRLQKGWSQEQLAEMSGLSVRTIQRIERGQSAGLESLKCLAAVFETQVETLQQETLMTTDIKLTQAEQDALEHVRDIKGFYSHGITYLIVNLLLMTLDFSTTGTLTWSLFAALGWGIGLISHGISVMEFSLFFGPEWEKRQVEKRLGRKL